MRGEMTVLKFLLITSSAGAAIDTNAVVTIFMLLFSAYLYLILTLSFFKRKAYKDPSYRPKVTALVPAHNEEGVIANVVKSLMSQDYEDLEVIVIDDASNDATPIILSCLQLEYPKLKVLRRELYMTRGKPAALNDAVTRMATGDVIAVFDADTILDADYFSRVIPYLADPEIAGVQTRVRMYNKDDNFWTRVQESEFVLYCTVMQAGRDVISGFCGLGGNGQFVKRRSLEAVGLWKPGMLTEDYDLTLTFLEQGYKIGFVDVPVHQEAVTGLKALIRQRNRWGQGNLQSTYRHIKSVFLNPKVAWFTKLDIAYNMTLPFQAVGLVLLFCASVFYACMHGIHLHFSMMGLGVFLTYVGFIAIGILKDNPRKWYKLPWMVFSYWLYSMLWSWMYAGGVIHYFIKRGNIQWAKTQHAGTKISA